MSRWFGDIRVGALPLALLAGLSCAATVLIIAVGGERSNAQLAALATLRQKPAVIAARRSPARTASPSAPPPAVAPTSESSSTPPATSQSSAATSANTATTAQTTAATRAPSTTHTPSALPKVGHVFEIVLSTDSYEDAFGKRSAAPYLRSLERKGVLLSGFASLGSSELANYVAMVSGQGPNADTSGGCTTYAEFPQGAAARSDGLVTGNGCVYPETALTIGDQVTASGHTWKAYIADMGAQTCAHPNSNAAAASSLPGTQPGYDTAHNPFIYFHSLVDLGDCANDDEDLSRLGPALARRSRTATFSFIAPGACDDPASDGAASPAATTLGTTTSTTATSTTTTTATTPTTTTTTATTPTTSTGSVAPGTCPTGQPTGIAGENAFLRLWVPRILASPAYRHNGVLVIAFASAAHPGSARPVRTGALLLSRFARRGKRLRRAFGPYSLLRSVETMLGYKPLAHARTAPSFAAAALTNTH